jgi:putative membrane protein
VTSIDILAARSRTGAVSLRPGTPLEEHDVAMLKWLLVRLLVIAAAFWVTAWLIPGFEVDGGFFTYLWVALIFGVVNAILGPILHLVSLPLTIITLGLFALVVNAVVLATVAGLSDKLDVGGFGWTIVAALVISIVSAVLGAITDRALAGTR